MRNPVSVRCILGAALLAAWPGAAALAAGNAGAGALIYEEECAECHALGAKNKKGPSLRGIFGRKAGTAPGFADYSDAVRKSGLIWTAQELDKYLTNPRQFSPTVRMKYGGLHDAKARADLIEFLASRK